MTRKKPLLGDVLRRARKFNKLTLENMEYETGLNTGLLSRLETGDLKNPTMKTMYRVLKAYGLQWKILDEVRIGIRTL